jgi:hypothetical protein
MQYDYFKYDSEEITKPITIYTRLDNDNKEYMVLYDFTAQIPRVHIINLLLKRRKQNFRKFFSRIEDKERNIFIKEILEYISDQNNLIMEYDSRKQIMSYLIEFCKDEYYKEYFKLRYII